MAGLCEPELLVPQENAREVDEIVKYISESFSGNKSKKEESFRVLKKGPVYGIIAVIAALPENGKAVFGQLLIIDDKDLRWVLRKNLKKKNDKNGCRLGK